MRERLADGRYGPVFLAHDPAADQLVVIRILAFDLDPGRRALLLDALQRACQQPLQHPSIAQPLTCGISDDEVFVVHAYLAGVTADEWVKRGRRPVAELLLPLAGMAAAVDFAAAVGVHHGALTAHDLIVGEDAGGVTGWGIEQARAAAGLTQETPSHEGDIASLARAVFELVDEADSRRLRPVFERAWSGKPDQQFASALAFAAALQQETADASVAPAAMQQEPAEIPAAPAPPMINATEEPLDVGELPFLRPLDVLEEPAVDHPASLSPLDDFAPAHIDTRRADAFGEPDRLRAAAPFSESAASLPKAEVFSAQEHSGAARTLMVPEPHKPTSSRWLLGAAVAVIMLAAGFAGGLFVGREQTVTVTPVPAAPLAAATSGTAFTDAPVVEPNAPPPASTSTEQEVPAAQPSSSGQAAGAVPSRNQSAETARNHLQTKAATDTISALEVDSRPRGAQVFVDGHLMGRTPMLAGSMRPGSHIVRLEMPGYKRWVAAVTLAAGERTRVAGSLEQ